ncbi:MAG: UvrD-helicase domain-containing protein [Bradymonadales bacterium]|nr:UvrD-helicase domain-containing protein [Bradymonadales bacterium]
MTHQEQLNPAQREAVEHTGGPLLILAGAGSGKTRVIVHRIAHLIQRHQVHPQHILGVTFTNKAAGEMVSRVARLLSDASRRPTWISTFHSLCARILRREAPALGFPRSFTIFDADDQLRMIKQVAEEMGIPKDGPSVASYQSFVERARNRGWLPQAAFEQSPKNHHQLCAQLYERYHQRMRANGTLDFGDLILAVIECLERFDPIRERYLAQWQHILVDEFQDTNPAQYRLLKLLTNSPFHIAAVGDDDQSIYAWRGATVENLLGFEHDFPGCRVVRLEQNYRSTQAILDLANAAIAVNRTRLPKVLWTTNRHGPKPVRFTGRHEGEEAAYIARQIELQRKRHQVEYGDIALFYRINAQSRIYEEQLRRSAIPYRVIAGTSFYEREEIKDILAYLRLAINPADDIAAMRIANVPRRGLGAKGSDQVKLRAQERGIPFFPALESMLEQNNAPCFRKQTREALQQLAALIRRLRSEARSATPPSQLTSWLIEQIDYLGYLQAVHPENAADRFDNVQELVNAMRDFEEERPLRHGESDTSLQGFLETSALVQAADQPTAQGAVNLMTIHAAKGLEFQVVFLTGLEDGLLPLVRGGAEEPENPDEERRLFYVAMTRAKEQLFLTDCLSRRLFGNSVANQPSRFLEAIDDRLLQTDPTSCRLFSPEGTAGYSTRSRSYPIPRTLADPDDTARSFATAPRRRLPESSETWTRKSREVPPPAAGRSPDPLRVVEELAIPPDGLRLQRPTRDGSELDALVGRIARHRTFGEGRITRAEYSGQRIKLTIQFPSVGTKCVISSYVEVV